MLFHWGAPPKVGGVAYSKVLEEKYHRCNEFYFIICIGISSLINWCFKKLLGD